jgi:hypothetical protein
MVGPFLLLNQNAANFGSDVFIAKWGYDSNVGIDKIDNHLLKIYPNPVTSTLHFNSEMPDGYFQLFDNTGRIVLSEKISTQKNQVDLSAIARGTYVARFTSNAAVFTGKIVKQ